MLCCKDCPAKGPDTCRACRAEIKRQVRELVTRTNMRIQTALNRLEGRELMGKEGARC